MSVHVVLFPVSFIKYLPNCTSAVIVVLSPSDYDGLAGRSVCLLVADIRLPHPVLCVGDRGRRHAVLPARGRGQSAASPDAPGQGRTGQCRSPAPLRFTDVTSILVIGASDEVVGSRSETIFFLNKIYIRSIVTEYQQLV